MDWVCTVIMDFLDSIINCGDGFLLGLGLCCLFSFSLPRSSPRLERRKSERWMLILKREDNATGSFSCAIMILCRVIFLFSPVETLPSSSDLT